jgi:hypothetical protein
MLARAVAEEGSGRACGLTRAEAVLWRWHRRRCGGPGPGQRWRSWPGRRSGSCAHAKGDRVGRRRSMSSTAVDVVGAEENRAGWRRGPWAGGGCRVLGRRRAMLIMDDDGRVLVVADQAMVVASGGGGRAMLCHQSASGAWHLDLKVGACEGSTGGRGGRD